MASPDLSDYVEVADRIIAFAKQYPEGSLQPWREPVIVEVAGQHYLLFAAAAYRTSDDPRPGVGSAWEPVPGMTPYTRHSELQNAETSAWGRAIVAVLAADTRKAVASANEIRLARDREPVTISKATDDTVPTDDLLRRVHALKLDVQKRLRVATKARGLPSLRVPRISSEHGNAWDDLLRQYEQSDDTST